MLFVPFMKFLNLRRLHSLARASGQVCSLGARNCNYASFFVSILYKEIILIMYLVWSFKVNSNKFLVLINKTNLTSSTKGQI